MDVAALGLLIDSSDAKKAKADLLQFSNAARVAEKAASGLSSASGKFSSAEIKAMASAMGNVERTSAAAARALAAGSLAAQKAAASTKAYTVAANQNVAGMVKMHNVGNLTSQTFDIVTTAAGGMQAGLIGMQQGLQIAQVALATTDGFAKTLAASFAAMLSPVVLLSVGLTTLAAVGIQSVDWSKTAASSIDYLADSLRQIAPYAAGAAAALALLYAPAAIGGLVQLIALMGRLATAAGAVAVSFAIANPFTAFVLGAVAAVAALNIFADEIKKVLGVDIVEVTKTAGNFIINSFEAAFEDIRVLWSSLGDIVGAAMTGAVNLVIQGLNHMVNGAKMAINDLIKAANHVPFVNISELDTASSAIQPMDNPYSNRLAGIGADRNARISEIMSQDRMGQFGSAIASGASTASEKLRELADWMTTVDDKGKKKSGGKTDADHYADIVQGANQRIASLRAEQAALGLTEEAAAKLRYETDLLNQAQQKGITLTAGQKAELSGLAGQMASIEVATKKAQEAMDFAKSTVGGFINDLRNGLRNGESFWESFGNAALSVLDRITDRLLNQVLDAVFQVSNAGSSSGGGLLSSLFGGLFGGGGKGLNYFPAAPTGAMYASGTASARAGYALVGEEGPEVVKFGGGEQVVPNHRLGTAFSGASSAANSNVQGNAGGETVIRLELSPDLEARIMQNTGSQTVKLMKQNQKDRQDYYAVGGEPR